MSGPEIGFTQESLQSYHLPVLRFITSLQILPRALTQCSDRHIGCRCGEKYHRAGILLPPSPLISDVKNSNFAYAGSMQCGRSRESGVSWHLCWASLFAWLSCKNALGGQPIYVGTCGRSSICQIHQGTCTSCICSHKPPASLAERMRPCSPLDQPSQ